MRPSNASFEALDFARLWRGRGHVVRLEQAVLASALGKEPYSNLLEIGTGTGRLTSMLRERARAYVGLDLTRSFVAQARDRTASGSGGDFVAANTYHLPFRSNIFDAATLIRVYNFLRSPVEALREISRCLVAGGVLVVSYHPRPSWGTLMDDLKSGLHPDLTTPRESMTWTRRPVVEVRPSSFPAWSPTRSEFVRAVGAAGFEVEEEYGTGWEDNRVGRLLPERFFVGLSKSLRPIPAAPLRFIRARKSISRAAAPPP